MTLDLLARGVSRLQSAFYEFQTGHHQMKCKSLLLDNLHKSADVVILTYQHSGMIWGENLQLCFVTAGEGEGQERMLVADII